MDSFFVPNLGSQIYTMNGMTTQLNLQADKPGVYPGLSTHFSGDGFPGMHFDLHATPPAQFAAWVAPRSAPADRCWTGRATPSWPSRVPTCAPTPYRSIDTRLFQDVVSLAVAPSPGPDQGRPNQNVFPKSSEHS